MKAGFNTQRADGKFRLQFETDNQDAFELMQIVARACVDGDISRLTELCEAYRDGRCVVLPPDGQIYHIEESVETSERWIGNKPCQYIMGDGYYCGWGLVAKCFPFSDLGRTVFLTREEAEAALNEVRPTIQAEPKVAEELYQNVNNASLEGSGGK